MKILSDIYQSTLEKIRYSNSKFLSSDIVTEFKGRSSDKKIAVTRNGLKPAFVVSDKKVPAKQNTRGGDMKTL